MPLELPLRFDKSKRTKRKIIKCKQHSFLFDLMFGRTSNQKGEAEAASLLDIRRVALPLVNEFVSGS